MDVDKLSGEVTLATPAVGTHLLEFDLTSAVAVDIAIKLDRQRSGFWRVFTRREQRRR